MSDYEQQLALWAVRVAIQRDPTLAHASDPETLARLSRSVEEIKRTADPQRIGDSAIEPTPVATAGAPSPQAAESLGLASSFARRDNGPSLAHPPRRRHWWIVAASLVAIAGMLVTVVLIVRGSQQRSQAVRDDSQATNTELASRVSAELVPKLDLTNCHVALSAKDCVLAYVNPVRDAYESASGIDLAFNFDRSHAAEALDGGQPPWAHVMFDVSSPRGAKACLDVSVWTGSAGEASVQPGTCNENYGNDSD